MLLEKIKSDLIEALKLHESDKVCLLRLITSEVKNYEIANYPPGLDKKVSDEDVLLVINRMVKTHRESIEMYIKGGRKDLENKEKEELELLLSYLPKQLSEVEIRTVVDNVIATSEKDFGKVMKLVMLELKGKADGKLVSEIVKEELEK